MLHKQEVGRFHFLEASSSVPAHQIKVYIIDLQIWQGLGGKRPEVLIKIERVLWRAIFRITQSASGGTIVALKLAFREIDEFLREADVTSIDWFDNGKVSLYSFYSGSLMRKSAHREDEPMDVDQSDGRSPLPVLQQGKRARSPGRSAENQIDLTSARQLCINGAMLEIIDLSIDEVRFDGCDHCHFLTPSFNRWMFQSEHYSIPKQTPHALLASHASCMMCLVMQCSTHLLFM
jgi:hypothetical protein